MLKKLLFLCFAVVVGSTAFSQSKQYVLFEHFTNAGCGPCAVQNPVFQSVVSQNVGRFHHVAYHTSGPGFDPMNQLNPSQVSTRANYYAITGVPSMEMLGSTWSGGPSGVTSDQIDFAAAHSAPLRLIVSDELTSGLTHTVTVEMRETGIVAGTNLKLRVAVVEKLVVYSSPPGTNGETQFPNTFRKLLPSTSGQAYTPSGAGTVQTLTFTYDELPEYNMDDVYVIAWLQDDSGKKVINSGSSLDPTWEAFNASASIVKGGPNNHDFTMALNSEGVDELVSVSLTTDAPADWAGSITSGGTIYTDSEVELDVIPNGMEVGVQVVPGPTVGIANYTLTITSLTYPDDPPQWVTYTVVSGLTDLVVDHGSVASQWNEDYEAGLELSGNSSFGTLPINKFIEGMENSELGDIEHIYDNVSWTFPGLTNSEVNVLDDFLDGGGNLFISGQDLGWDTWENEGTAVTQAFYTDYMRAEFVDDGNGANSQLTWTNDLLFSTVGNSSLIDVYPGASFYPDVVAPLGPAMTIYNYNNLSTKPGAIRVDENGHKVVYLGVDLGMISDQTVRHQIISISHDWFHGLVSSLEYDLLIQQALGQNYPNPATGVTSIPLVDLQQAADIMIIDAEGRQVHQGRVFEGQKNYELSVDRLGAGSYFYYLSSEEGRSEAIQFQVLK